MLELRYAHSSFAGGCALEGTVGGWAARMCLAGQLDPAHPIIFTLFRLHHQIVISPLLIFHHIQPQTARREEAVRSEVQGSN